MLVVNEVQVSVMIEDLGMVDVLLRVVKKKRMYRIFFVIHPLTVVVFCLIH